MGAPRRTGGRGRGVCYAFQDTGNCQYGDGCRFAHGADDSRPPAGDFNGGGGGGGFPQNGGGAGGYRPRRSGGGGICFNFRDQGDCQYNDACRFSHDLTGGAAKYAFFSLLN
jgi:hypothetical protein